MRKRSLVAAVALLTATLCQPATSRADQGSPSEEVGYALAALGGNLLYVPLKTVVAVGGLALGSLLGLASGGDQRTAYALWVPAASGTFILRSANISGAEPIEFFGSDYADEASPIAGVDGSEGGELYKALYR